MTWDSAPRPDDVLGVGAFDLSQTRTQRVQRMQRLWSMPKRRWLASTSQVGSGIEADVVHPERGQLLQLAVAVGDADRADVVAFGEEQFHECPAVLLASRSVFVLTSMPSSTFVMQAGSSLPIPCTSTRQSRQAPMS